MTIPRSLAARLLFFSLPAHSLPLDSVTPSGNIAYIAVPITVSAILIALLLVLRWVWRRASKKLVRQVILSNYSDGSRDSAFSCSEKSRSAFWVGFFGSPNWETEHQSLLPQGDLSYVCSIETRSRKSIPPSSRCSVIDTSNPASPALSAIIDTRALYNIPNKATPRSARSQSLRLPSYPLRAKLSTKTRRHRSLPSDYVSTSKPLRNHTRSSTHSSGRSTKSRQSILASKSRTTSSRSPTNSPPLPTSPEFPPPMTPAQLHAISPLSPIEIGVFPSSCSLRPPPSRRIRSSPQLSYCSTPCTPIAELSPDAHQGYSLTTGRIIRRKPRSIHPIPEVEPLPSFTIDSTVGHISLDPMNYATALHSKPRARQLRSKAASSPSIGPSPLRNVVTPAEVSNSVIAKQTSLGNPGYNHIGLGFPSSPPHRRHVPKSSTPLREDGDDDADILMEVLRELVEEAAAWDPSMSMNKNFKALIHNSTASSSEESKTSSTDSSNSSSQSPSVNTTLSAEVDLVLLGVDIYPGDTPVALRQDVLRHGSAKERAMLKFDLPSFWDDQDSSTADSDRLVSAPSMTEATC